MYGDGHCIVNSVLACMKIAQQEFPVPEKDVLLCEIRKSVLLNLDYYGQFFNSEEIDPIHEIDAYINMGKYNTPTNDLMLNIIFNLLKCQIIILQHNPVTNNYALEIKLHILNPINPVTGAYIEPCFTLMLRRDITGNHYDGLVESALYKGMKFVLYEITSYTYKITQIFISMDFLKKY